MRAFHVTFEPFSGGCGCGRRGAAVRGADGRTDALRLRAAATAHVACQVHASLHLGHPELRRKGSSHIHTDSKITTNSARKKKNKKQNWQFAEM